MTLSQIEGALFLSRRVLLSKFSQALAISDGRKSLPRVFSLCVSPFGVRFAISESVLEEKEATRAFLTADRGGFRFDAPKDLRPDSRIRSAQETLWSSLPLAARSLVLIGEATVSPNGRAHIDYEKAHLYNRPCPDVLSAVGKVSRPLPDTLRIAPDAKGQMWIGLGLSSREVPLLIPATSESEAAIRAVYRLSHAEPHPVPEAWDLRISPLPQSGALEIATKAGLFAPAPDNDPHPILSS